SPIAEPVFKATGLYLRGLAPLSATNRLSASGGKLHLVETGSRSLITVCPEKDRTESDHFRRTQLHGKTP
ncbi:hypothetical protein JMM51_18790, partial [Rhodovulum sulfidophilum]|nr:hypothetical protein [Rhodovulum sulfidophilum]